MKTNEIIALSLNRDISNKEIINLAQNFESIDHILSSKQGKQFKLKFDKGNLFDFKNEYLDKAEKQVELAEKNASRIITINDKDYPALLKNIADPPVVLYVKGTLYEEDTVSISVVGTRKATTYGRLVVEKFVSQFVENNVIITSGLAYGIDSFAHDQTIKNNGITYAVLANGLDKINTDRARKLASKIIENRGCLISSYPFGTAALPPFFISRNRIISGISKATIVVESDMKGGSLWTAKFTLDQNRDLFAVPGNIFESKSKGTNSLIERDMAIPALSAEQILTHIGFSKISQSANTQVLSFDNENEKKIFEFLSFEPVRIDDIANQTKIPIAEVNINLLTLEFKSLIRQLPGNLFIKNTDK
jgi:DNA processing protein